jgi:hypothetical protein
MLRKEQAAVCGETWLHETPVCKSLSDFCPYSSTGLRYSLFNIFYNVFIKGEKMKSSNPKIIENVAVRLYYMQDDNREDEFTIQKIAFLNNHIKYLDEDFDKTKQINARFDFDKGNLAHKAFPHIVKELFRTSHGNDFEYGVINRSKKMYMPFFFIMNYDVYSNKQFRIGTINTIMDKRDYDSILIENIHLNFLPFFIIRNDIIKDHHTLPKNVNITHNGQLYGYKLVGATISLSRTGGAHAIAGLSCEDTWYMFDSNNVLTYDNWQNGEFSEYLKIKPIYSFHYYSNAIYVPTSQIMI